MQIMKKTMMFLLAALMGTAVLEAQPALRKGLEGKRLDREELAQARYVGRMDQLDAWVMEGKKHTKQVVLTDVNLEPVSALAVEGSSEMDVLAATVDGRHAALLLVQRGSKRTVVVRCELDFDHYALVGYDTVATFDYGRKDECMLWGASSPSGNHSAMVCIIQLNESKQYFTSTLLFDGRMYRQWEKEYGLGSMHEMAVTDDGMIVTLGEERNGEEEHFVFNVMDSGRAATYDAVVKCDPVGEVHLANVVDGRAVAVGVYRPAMGRNAEKMTAGILTLTFDVRTATTAGFTMRPFQNEDMNIFMNTKTRKIQKDQVCDHIVVQGWAPTPYGAVLALGRQVEVERTSETGSVRREGYALGLNMTAVDTTGHVRWVRNVRRSEMSDGGGVPALGFATVGDRVCVVKCEDSKTPLTYDISNETRRIEQGDKGNLVLYSVASDGTVEKLLLERKSKHTVFRALRSGDGKLLFLSSVGKKTRMAELTWQ